jgi:hypothetical protein
MSALSETPGWDDVVQLELLTRAAGGPGGPANAQAQAIVNRLALLKNSRVVLTLAQLRAVDGSVHKVAFSAGGAALGDGNGGWYWVDDADTTSVDNGSSVIVGGDGKRWKQLPGGPGGGVTLANNLTTNNPAVALAASQGVAIAALLADKADASAVTAALLGKISIIDKTADQIAAPDAGMLADLKSVYRSTTYPYPRYFSDGYRLVPMESLESSAAYSEQFQTLSVSRGLPVAQYTASGVIRAVPCEFAGFLWVSGSATSVEFFDHASAASGQSLLKVSAPVAGTWYSLPLVERTLLGLYMNIVGGSTPVANVQRS